VTAPLSPALAATPRRPGRRAVYWSGAATAAIIVMTMVFLRTGEMAGALRVVKPVLLSVVITLGLHAIQSNASAWREVRNNAFARLVVAYIGCIALSVPFSIWRSQSMGLLQITPWGLAMTIVLLMVPPSLANQTRMHRWLVWMGAVTGLLIINAGVAVENGRISTGASYDPNDLGAMFALLVPLGIAASMRGNVLSRVVSVVATTVIVISLFKTGSRGALLALSAGVIIYVAGLRPSRVMTWVFVLAIGIPVGWPFAPEVMKERARSLLALEDDYNTTSNSGRVYLWKRGIYFTLQRPLTGIGAATFEERVGRDFAEQGTRGAWHTAHNTYVQVFAELGVIGGTVLLLLLGRMVRAAAATWRYTSKLHRPEIMASLGAYLVGILFLSHGYSYLLFGMIALLALHERVIRGASTAPVDSRVPQKRPPFSVARVRPSLTSVEARVR
jgi:O-antigen ligase